MSTETDDFIESELPDLRFCCTACSEWLEVPVSFAGVTAPCPFCEELVTAPDVSPEVGGATVEDGETDAAEPEVVVSVSISADDVEAEADEPAESSEAEESLPVATPLVLRKKRSRHRAGHHHKAKRNVPAKKAPPLFKLEDDTSPVSESSEVNRWDRFFSWGAALLFFGTLGCASAVLAFGSKPAPADTKNEASEDLTLRVQMQKVRIEEKKLSALMQAMKIGREFLSTQGTSSAVAVKYLNPAASPDEPVAAAPPLFNLQATHCRRIPGTENFVTTLESEPGGPVAVVEDRPGGSFIHGDASRQQLGKRLEAFVAGPRAGSEKFYLQARPFTGEFILEELAAWPKVNVQSAFSSENPVRFVASAQPGSEAAKHLERRSNLGNWTEAVLELRWSKSPSGRDFLEVAKVIPNAWAKF